MTTDRPLADRYAAEVWSGVPANTIRLRVKPVACDRASRRALYDLEDVARLRDTTQRRRRDTPQERCA